jgi:hypothetical protein
LPSFSRLVGTTDAHRYTQITIFFGGFNFKKECYKMGVGRKELNRLINLC